MLVKTSERIPCGNCQAVKKLVRYLIGKLPGSAPVPVSQNAFLGNWVFHLPDNPTTRPGDSIFEDSGNRLVPSPC
jgi:hypothetical protein